MVVVRGFVRSLADWIEASGHGRVVRLFDPKWVECKSRHSATNPKLASLSKYLANAGQLFFLDGGCVLGDEGAIGTLDGQLILSTIVRPGTSALSDPVWSLTNDQAVRLNIDGTVGVVTHHGARSFSHVMGDLLARIWLIRQLGIEPDAWVVPSPNDGWHEELFSLAGIPPARRVLAHANTVLTARVLIVPQASGFAVGIAPWARTAVREYVTGTASSTPGPHLWFSRAAARRRTWPFEPEIHSALHARGFVVVEPERLSVSQQARLVAAAPVIAGPHGGALCWPLAAAVSRGLLFEVSRPEIVHNDYPAIAAVCNWNYERTPAIADFGATESDLHNPITVAPEIALRSLDEALAHYDV